VLIGHTGHEEVAYLIDDASGTRSEWLRAAETIGLTAGASVPQILASLGLRLRQLEIVSCHGCGRLQADLHMLTQQVQAAFDGFPTRCASRSWAVWSTVPAGAREADLGVSCDNGKGQIFVGGEVVATAPEHDIVNSLLEHALALVEKRQSDANADQKSGMRR
jgi:4-hydroxy-3-methylbut-2-en-1-yl diphosphate synthase IspG/GcpE